MDGNGTSDLEQERTHNAANEITGITTTTGTQWEEVQQDAAGNITWMPFPLSPQNSAEPVYDAWNRLVAMTDGGEPSRVRACTSVLPTCSTDRAA